MNPSNLFLRAAVLFALVGMGMGIVMSVRHDFTLSPVHAHINLVGWASMFLYGLFYRIVPEAGAQRLATAHVWVAVPGLVLMAIGITGVVIGNPALEPAAAVGSILTALGMVLFTAVVFRHSRSAASAASAAAAAE